MTCVSAMSYDFRTRTGQLTMPDLCCTDMGGCIRLFTAIDPDVVRIEAISGDAIDTLYSRGPHGWQARRP